MFSSREQKVDPSFLENMSEAVILVNPDSQIELVNGAALNLLKYTSEELVGRKVDEIFENAAGAGLKPGPERFGASYKLAPAIVARNDNEDEANCLDADGNKIPVKVFVKKVYDKSQSYLGSVYILKHISEIKNTLKALGEKQREVEQKETSLRVLSQELQIENSSIDEKANQTQDFGEERDKILASISNLSLGFIMTNSAKNIVLYNKAASNFFPSLMMKSKTISVFIQAEQISVNLNDIIEQSMREKRVIATPEAQINSKFANIFVSPVVLRGEPDAKCWGTVIIIEDKTEEHTLDEAKEDRFSIASHELRTPLTAIYGYTSLIKQIYFADLKNQELKNMINNIGLLSKKLSLSVNNFLDSSKLERGKIELKREPVDIITTISEAIKETRVLAMEKNLYIRFDSPLFLITVTGDKNRLIQVLIILLTNGIKFTQYGGIFIAVQINDNFAKISVQGTGSGITEESMNFLFSNFAQTDDNLLTRQEGTGFGLRTAKLLVEQMGGNLFLEKTELNKGSTSSFTVPLELE